MPQADIIVEVVNDILAKLYSTVQSGGSPNSPLVPPPLNLKELLGLDTFALKILLDREAEMLLHPLSQYPEDADARFRLQTLASFSTSLAMHALQEQASDCNATHRSIDERTFRSLSVNSRLNFIGLFRSYFCASHPM